MFNPITNPYIVGNPIKTKSMFYGREDDFEFIRRKLESGSKSYIIVLSGERRSGKTSILFQILNGELGENFLPILIDMQTMAGLKNESEFFEKFGQETIKHLDDRFSTQKYNFHSNTESPYKIFSLLLDDIHNAYTDKNIIILIDEYELIETKSEEGSLSPNFVPFLSGLLESEKKISFIFTGSRTLQQRGTDFWQNLFGKSLFRNVSFLSEQDTIRLITQPVEGKITFDNAVLKAIYRLTSGQPFYTQIVGQNIVDYVNETQKTNIEMQNLEHITNEILENPLPQMIYFWNSLPASHMLMLSLLSEVIEGPETQIKAAEFIKQVKKKKLGLTYDNHALNTVLEALYHQKYVSKSVEGYSFQIDLMRQWIKRDHSIWRVMKEVDIGSITQSERPSDVEEIDDSKIESTTRQKNWIIPAALGLVLILVLVWWIIPGEDRDQPDSTQDVTESTEKPDPVEESTLKSNPPAIKTPAEDKTTPVQQAEKKPVIPKQKKTSPPSRQQTRQPERQDPYKSQINSFKSAMNISKKDAVQAGAQELAVVAFRNGIDAENQAEDFQSNSHFQASTEKYREAENHFKYAKQKSQRISEKAQQDIPVLLAHLQDIQKDLKEHHRTIDEYQKAETLRKEGKQFTDQGKYLPAYNTYEEALSFYQQVLRIRNSQSEKINQAILNYVKTLENKNIADSKYIQNDYKKVLQEQWQQFFKVAEDIKLDFNINEIKFEKASASALVNVQMQYSGAKGSGKTNKWKIDLKESGKDWFITKISQAN